MKVINESVGGNGVPDGAADIIKAADDAAVATRIARTAHDHAERALWRIWLPTLLAAAAASSAVAAMRTGQHSPTRSPPSKERHDDNDEDRHHEPAPSDEVGAA